MGICILGYVRLIDYRDCIQVFGMDIRKLLKVNTINIIILALVFLFKFVTGFMFDDHSGDNASIVMMTNVITAILLVGWAGYTIYSNMTVIKEYNDRDKALLAGARSRLLKAGNQRCFTKERQHLVKMWDSMMTREKYFLSKDRDDRVKDLYLMTRNQMMRYVTDASEYMESFDYISGKDSGYLKGLCNEAEVMLNKFNTIVELSVSVDDEVLSYDTREMDDMIEALEELKESGKNKLAR